jgi:DNA polymerase-3 subunit epsilon
LAERFEEAAEVRNRLSSYIRGTARAQRITAITRVSQIVTALKIPDINKWEFVVIRYGRLVGSALSAPGVALAQTIESLTLSAEVVVPEESVLPASTHEEIEILLNYLESPGLRLVEVIGEWKLPIYGSANARASLADLRKSYESDNRWLAATQFDSN